MKFLCPNCKAKYQISDEKIAGRTLKMDCRRCNHPIVIRGNAGQSGGRAKRRPSTSSGSLSSPARRPGGSGVGPAPSRSSRSALGSDFRRQAAAPPPPQRPTALDQWHVAINDVPVGPMKRDEIAKKMASGAIKPDSLCWREGFDDWREVGKVPELAALMRRARPAAPPPPKPIFPSPSRPMGRSGSVRPARPPSARMPAAAPARSQAARPAARAASPAPSNVVPIGGRLGASAAPALEEPVNDFMDEEPTRVGSSFDFEQLEAEIKGEAKAAPIPPAPPAGQLPAPAAASPAPTGGLAPQSDAFDPFASQAGAAPVAPGALAEPSVAAPPAAAPAAQPAERRRRAIPIGAWIAIAGAMAFGVALAVMVGTHFLTQPPEVATAAPTAPADPTPDPGPDPDLVVPDDPPTEEPPEGEPTTPSDEPTGEAPANSEGTAGRRRGGGRAGTTTATGGGGTTRPNPGLTEEQRRRLEAAGEDNSLPAPIAGRRGGGVLDEGGSRGGGANELSGDQIAAVVRRGQSQIQQCYEVMARQSGTAPSLRINARVTIGPSGTVQRVSATGGSFGNLTTCIERRVRQWHFPRSSGSTTTTMPFVFTGRDD